MLDLTRGRLKFFSDSEEHTLRQHYCFPASLTPPLPHPTSFVHLFRNILAFETSSSPTNKFIKNSLFFLNRPHFIVRQSFISKSLAFFVIFFSINIHDIWLGYIFFNSDKKSSRQRIYMKNQALLSSSLAEDSHEISSLNFFER